MFEIDFTQTALDDLRYFRRFERNIVLDAIDTQLSYTPTTETGNRFRRDPPEIGAWELRIGEFRVLYDADEVVMIARVERIGNKPNNTLYLRGRPWKSGNRRRRRS